MKCKDCACYKDNWCTMVTGSPDPDMKRDCGRFIRAQRWVPVTERLPETWEPVLAYCKYGTRKDGYVCCAFYVAPGTYEEDSDFSWDYEALGNYNEEKDSYEIPAGWYERIHNWDDYGSVGIYSNVTHWMPLPEPPESEGENG